MARYIDEYRGISGHDEPPHGMDPNYRGGYGGMRMGGHPGQAAYGRYRMGHGDDLGGANGAFGMYPGRGMYTGEYEAGYDRPGHRGYEPNWHGGGYDRGVRGGRGGGGVHGWRDDRMVWGRGPGYDQGMGGRTQPGRYDRSMFGHDRGYRPGYANRGVGSGGYSEGWAWGPMRGAR